MQDMLRRCVYLVPVATDSNQRHGRERWPWMIDAVDEKPAKMIQSTGRKNARSK